MSLDLATLQIDANNSLLKEKRLEIYLAKVAEDRAKRIKEAKKKEYWELKRKLAKEDIERLEKTIAELWDEKKFNMAVAAKIELERRIKRYENTFGGK